MKDYFYYWKYYFSLIFVDIIIIVLVINFFENMTQTNLFQNLIIIKQNFCIIFINS